MAPQRTLKGKVKLIIIKKKMTEEGLVKGPEVMDPNEPEEDKITVRGLSQGRHKGRVKDEVVVQKNNDDERIEELRGNIKISPLKETKIKRVETT